MLKRSDEAVSNFKMPGSLKDLKDDPNNRMGLLRKLHTTPSIKKIDVPVSWISLGSNVRSNIDEESPQFKALVASIAEVGLLQPIVVRPLADKIELISGHRRLQAWSILCKQDSSKYSRVTAIVQRIKDNKRPLAQLVENANRENLNPMDLADAYREVQIAGGYKIKDLSELFGRNADYVGRNLKIASWPNAIKVMIRAKPDVTLKMLHSVAMKKDSRTEAELTQHFERLFGSESKEKKSLVKNALTSKQAKTVSLYLGKNSSLKAFEKKINQLAESFCSLPEETRHDVLNLMGKL